VYNGSMTPKQLKFIDEYLVDFNATQAYIRAGYKGKGAYASASKLLRNPEIKAELERRMAESRITPEQIIARLDAMAEGKIPTKIIEMPSRTYGKPVVKKEYDTRGALQDIGKVYALFVDKQIVENIDLEIVDDEESDPADPPASS